MVVLPKIFRTFRFSRDDGSLGLIREWRGHVPVLPCRPLRARDVTHTGRGQVPTGLAVRECAHHASSSSDLAHDPLQRVVGSQLDPIGVWQTEVDQGLMAMLLEQFGRLDQFHCT